MLSRSASNSASRCSTPTLDGDGDDEVQGGEEYDGPVILQEKLRANASSSSLSSNSSQFLWDTVGDCSISQLSAIAVPSDQPQSTQPNTVDHVGARTFHRSAVPRCDSNTSATSETTLVAGCTGLKRKNDTELFASDKRPCVVDLTSDPDNPFVEHPMPSPEEPFVIAYHDFIWNRLRRLSFGAQWEIARLVTNGDIKFSDIHFDHLSKLEGTNSEAAPLVSKMFRKLDQNPGESFTQLREKAFEREIAARSPWGELDEEEKYLKISQYGALGCRIGNDGTPTTEIPASYYGGKVQFSAKLVQSEDGTLRVVLENAELGTSHRFARRFGSTRFLKLSIPDKLLSAKRRELDGLLRRPFVLFGWVFRMFFTREGNVHMVRTEENYGGVITPASFYCTSPLRSLSTFRNWHNPIELNTDQSVAKWVDRFALGLSTSVPGLILEQSNIIHIPDVYCPGYDGVGKPPSEVIMTDGCGFINRAALREIYQRWEPESFPTALQVRVGGAKGLLLMHPNEPLEDDPNVPRVWIRPSQLKIKYAPDEPLDPANRIIDVLRFSKVRVPSSISHEIIINLDSNGVKITDFVDMMKIGIKELADKLMTWDGPDAMQRLFHNVSVQGGLVNARRGREAKAEMRVRGMGDPNEEEKEEADYLEALLKQLCVREQSSAWWKDEISGCPSSLEETVVDLLSAGFTPKDSPVCAKKLSEVFKTGLNRFTEKYKMVIPGSAMAFIVPDPTESALKPGEIFFSSSKPIIGPDNYETNILTGEVLVGRYPCKLPSDIQKVTAVDHEELRKFRDVIIFPVIDYYQSLASLLGGGDYDGDKVILVWQPEIVRNFTNADICRQPRDLLDDFEQAKEKVSQFLEKAPVHDPTKHIPLLQTYCLNPILRRMETGRYSTMHENSAYMYGYTDPRTVRLAFMFCQCLDGPKAGLLAVKKHVLSADLKAYFNYQPPYWRKAVERDTGIDCSNFGAIRRYLPGSFVMDTVKRKIDEAASVYRKKFVDHLNYMMNPRLFDRDEDLVRPWEEACKRAEEFDKTLGGVDSRWSMLKELEQIKEHVHAVRKKQEEDYKEVNSQVSGLQQTSPSKHGNRDGSSFTKLPITIRQDILRTHSAMFASGPCNLVFFDDDKLAQLRASYAYLYDREPEEKGGKWSGHPWNVAFSALCEIKAKALGLHQPITSHFYNVMVMHRSIRDTPQPS